MIRRRDLETELDDRIRRDGRRIVVFDDDPTGTQTVSDIDVLLEPSDEGLDRFFKSGSMALYVLTNTRAYKRQIAVDLLTAAVEQVGRAAARYNIPWAAVLRGDSTLRGHIFAEIDAIGGRDSVTLFVPAFPEGGRITRAGQQLVSIDGRLWNAADTEFARDHTFGYVGRDLQAWVQEVGGPRAVRTIPLDVVRSGGPDAVARILAGAGRGTVVIPDAENTDDLRNVALGLLEVESAGVPVVVRCASSFAAIRSNSRAKVVTHVVVRAPGRILIVCGSHTHASSDQLEALRNIGVHIAILSLDGSIEGLTDELATRLDRDCVAALATPRDFHVDAGLGPKLMSRLVAIVLTLEPRFDAIVSKGGITSAELARTLGSGFARVEGQLAAGVSVWTLSAADRADLPLVVVPGNVGDDQTIVRALDAITVE